MQYAPIELLVDPTYIHNAKNSDNQTTALNVQINNV